MDKEEREARTRDRDVHMRAREEGEKELREGAGRELRARERRGKRLCEGEGRESQLICFFTKNYSCCDCATWWDHVNMPKNIFLNKFFILFINSFLYDFGF